MLALLTMTQTNGTGYNYKLDIKLVSRASTVAPQKNHNTLHISKKINTKYLYEFECSYKKINNKIVD